MEPEDRERLVRIEEKVDVVVERGGDHETRLRSLERWKYSLPVGILAGVAAIVFGGK